MKILKRSFLALLSIMIGFFSCSCARATEKSTLEILRELVSMGEYAVLSEPLIYSSLADEGDAEYLSPEIKISMYGEKRVSECFDLIEDCAVCVCPGEISELAVFKCYSKSDTDLVAAMCLERADSLSIALNSIDALNKNQKAHIEIHGRYVLFSFADQSESLIVRFRKLT